MADHNTLCSAHSLMLSAAYSLGGYMKIKILSFLTMLCVFCFLICVTTVPTYAAEIEPSQPSTEVVVPEGGLFGQAYSMFQYFIYGDSPITGHMDFVLTILATTLVLMATTLPFLLLYWIVRRV